MGWTTKKQWINVISLNINPLVFVIQPRQGKEESAAVI
jgi:hypothetical protein